MLLTDGADGRHEVTRVAYAREDSRHKGVDFVDQLRAEIATAEEAAEALNEALDEFERAQADELERGRQRIADLLPPAPHGRALPA